MTDEQPPSEWTTFSDARRRKFTMALALTPAERLAWLERAIALAVPRGCASTSPCGVASTLTMMH